MNNNKIDELDRKLSLDYQTYKNAQLRKSKEELFQNSYQNMLIGEWQLFFENFLEDEHDDIEEIIDDLLSLDNIYDELIDHCSEYDSVDTSQDSFSEMFKDFTLERVGVIAN